jgi:hypothetical protein
MNFFDYTAIKVWFADEAIFVELDDNRKASLPLQQFPALQKASPIQRMNFEIIGSGYAIHWKDLNEDLSVAGFFENKPEPTHNFKKASAK